VDINAQAACDVTVATPGEWQCGVRRLAVANGPNIFQMLLVCLANSPIFFHYFFNDRLLAPISEYNGPYSLLKIGRCMEGLDNLVYHFAIPQGMLPWQPIFDTKSLKLLSCWHSKVDYNIAITISKD